MIDIPKLNTDFNAIIRLRNELQDKRTLLETKMNEIREHYNELVQHNSKKIYLYCLDSFYFQYKILRIELEQFQKMISLIFNRMYGDYYKLYHIINTQCKDNSVDIDIPTDNIVLYKELDPLTEYKLDEVIITHTAIINMLNQLNNLYISKYNEINHHNDTMRVGFSVTSFISTLSYENKILGGHVTLYSDYLAFYHSSQRRYFDMVLYKINNFIREIEDDILTNHKNDIEPKLEPEQKLEVKPQPNLEPEQKLEVKPQLNLEPAPKLEVKPKPNVEVKHELKLEVKPQPNIEASNVLLLK